YESRLIRRDAPVMEVMQELAAQYPRYGYRRIQVFLERRGHRMSADRAHRLWRQCGLQVPRKRPRRRIANSRPRPLPATGAGYLWAYDFVFDACANGQQLKCLTVIDEYTRECLAIEVLSKLVSVHGAPRYLRSDNGPEFVSRAVLKWLAEANIDTAFIDPGKPWLNGMNESFNGQFRSQGRSVESRQVSCLSSLKRCSSGLRIHSTHASARSLALLRISTLETWAVASAATSRLSAPSLFLKPCRSLRSSSFIGLRG